MRWTLESRGSWAIAWLLATTACTDRLVGASGGDTGDGGGDDDDAASEPESGEGDDEVVPDDGDDPDDAGEADDTLATVTDATDASDATTFDGESTGDPALPCESVLAESRRCALLDDAGDIRLVGLDSGAECPFVDVAWKDAPPQLEFTLPGGLVWHDDAFYSCAGELVRIELDGTIGASGLPCWTVTAHDEALVVYDNAGGDLVREYATWADAVALGPSTVHALSGMLASRFAVADGVIYGAWHSTDRVERRDFDNGDVQPDVVLSGFDDRVDGIDVDAGEILITNDNVLLRFDAETGASIGEIATSGAGFGTPLDCRAP
jgi:hypothetical protein